MKFEVWVVFPEAKRSATSEVRDRLRKECRNRSWWIQERPSRARRFNGRPVQLLSGRDAANLYRRAHRARVALFVAGRPLVPLTPDVTIRIERTVPLIRFIRYKAHARPLPTVTADVSRQLDSCEAWHRSTKCEGGRDPRCLPLHVFASQRTDLDERTQRQAFDGSHGTGACRVDNRGLTWRLDPKNFHGRERLHVAGCELPSGFHWDVSVPNGPRELATGTEHWLVSRYINIAPDAHFRGRAPYARKIKHHRN